MKKMSKKDQNIMLLGQSSLTVAIVSTMDKSGGSTLENLIMGIVTGLALVGCCKGLWDYRKSRENQ